MGQYMRTPAPPSGIITPEYLHQELTKIAEAHNTHHTGDFPNNCVDNSGDPDVAPADDQALEDPYSYYTLELWRNDLPGACGTGVIQNAVVVPVASDLVDVRMWVRALGTSYPGSAHQADVYLEDGSPATILTGLVTLDELTWKTGAISGGTLACSANDVLSLRCFVGIGTPNGHFYDLRVQLVFKSLHVSD